MDIETSTTRALQMAKEYYAAYDKHRINACNFYDPSAKLLWDGHPRQGKDAILDFLLKLPASKHQINAIDCHPLFS